MQATAAPVIVIAIGIVGAYYAAGQSSTASESAVHGAAVDDRA
jgi:uncharacterized protein (UPF0333 family)